METEARHFLKTLFAGKPDDLYILIWTRQDKQSQWFRSVDDGILFVESLSGKDVYVGIGLANRDRGLLNRCKSDEIAGAVAVIVDIDLRSDAHPNKPLPTSIEDALQILPTKFPPTFVIASGNGVHGWWVFKEPWVFQDEEDRKQGASLAKRWNTMISDNGRLNGWHIERLGDLARVLRIPDTSNYKDPVSPKKVYIYSSTDSRYNPSDLVELLDELGIPDEDAEESARSQWIQGVQDRPLILDLSAEIPEAQLLKWTESDPRFKDTWFRHRIDLPDQSQSGYDLALANFGYREGLEEQQIIDLLVQHRRIHKQNPRNKLDYFYRTLSKAANQPKTTFQLAPPSEGKQSADAAIETESDTRDPNPGYKPGSDKERINLYRQLSVAFGVDLLRIVKVKGEEPFYRMELAAGSISFSSVGKLLSQTVMRTSIAGRVGKLIRPFKRSEWQLLAQMMLDACIEEDGGEELEAQGSARLLIGEYLATTEPIPGLEGQHPQDVRKPMLHRGRISVCASELQLYINKGRSQTISIPVVVGMLQAVGATVERVRVKGCKEQSRWMLPRVQFDPADNPIAAAPGGAIQHD